MYYHHISSWPQNSDLKSRFNNVKMRKQGTEMIMSYDPK